MQKDYIPYGDGDFRVWLDNFTTTASFYRDALGLTDEEADTLVAGYAAFKTQQEAAAKARAAAISATGSKDAARDSITDYLRPIVRRIQANPDVDVNAKGFLLITIPDAVRNHTPPAAPTGLQVTPGADGTHRLQWQRNGNKPNTIFQIEAKSGAEGEWQMAGSASATKFRHVGQVPGAAIVYRVTAVRAGKQSLPSGEAGIYIAAANRALKKAA